MISFLLFGLLKSSSFVADYVSYQRSTEGHITEFMLCVGWLGENGSAVRGYLMKCFWIVIAVWLVLDPLDF